MAYIGNTAPSRFVSNRAASVYSGDGSTVAFTLEQVVTQDEDVLVSVDGVIQEPSVGYAVSSGTTLTFSAAPSTNSGNNIFVYYLASQTGTVGHPSSQALSATNGTFTGNTTVGGTLGVTGTATLSGNATIGANDGDTRFHLNSANQYTMKFSNAGNVSGHIGGGGSDVLRFSNAAGATIMEMNAGQMTKPLQPAFLAQPASLQTNIPINAVTTIAFGTERFDIGANFASNTFTAPVTGKYQLNVQLLIQELDKDSDFLAFELATSNRSFVYYHDNDGMAADMPNGKDVTITVLADMDASDTALVKVTIPNSGAAQMDIVQSSAFSGFLAC